MCLASLNLSSSTTPTLPESNRDPCPRPAIAKATDNNITALAFVAGEEDSMTDGYFVWRHEIYDPQMKELSLIRDEITARHAEALRRELEPIECQISELAKENTTRLGGPN